MTSTVNTENNERRILIACDGHGCDQHHDNEAIAIGGGLFNMGWKTKFDEKTRKLQHFCPAHIGEANG